MIIVNFYVIAHRSKEIGSSQPRKEGRKLWNIMFSAYNGRICILIDGANTEHRKLIEEWLKKESFKAGFVDYTYDTGPDAKLDKIRSIYAAFQRVDWYIDIDPVIVAKVMKEGVPALLMAVPDTLRPEWDNGRKTAQWDTLITEMEQQALRKAERTWRE
jgi:hypothetical protein